MWIDHGVGNSPLMAPKQHARQISVEPRIVAYRDCASWKRCAYRSIVTPDEG